MSDDEKQKPKKKQTPQERLRELAGALGAGIPAAPKTVDDAVHWSSWALRALSLGRIDARTAHEVGYLVTAFRESVAKRDSEREIADLKRIIVELRKELEESERQRQTRPQAVA